MSTTITAAKRFRPLSPQSLPARLSSPSQAGFSLLDIGPSAGRHRALIRVPTDRSALDKAALLPACRKPSLTRVSYSDTVVGAGAAWSIKGLSSTHLNETPENGGQNFHGPVEGL